MMKLDRRALLASAAGAFALRPGLPFAQAASPRPPVARVEPVTETLHGVAVTDPYRWMENPKDPDWAPWMKGQADHARRVLDAIPGRAAMARRVAQLSGEDIAVSAVQVGGPFIFTQVRPQGANTFKLLVREGMTGRDRVLVDPDASRTGEAHSSLDWWQASPDGRHVVYGLSPAGSEDSIAHVIETATGRVLPVRIDRTQYASPSWLPDGSGFFYNRLAEGAARGSLGYYKNSVAWLHRLGTDPARDMRVLSRGQFPDVPVAEIEFPGVFIQPGSTHAVAALFAGVQPEIQLFSAPLVDVLGGRARWKRITAASDQVTNWTVRGDDIHLLTYKGAPRYRVLRTSLAQPSVAGAREVVATGRSVVTGLYAAHDGVYLTDLDGGVGRLRKLTPDGRVVSVALPVEGTLTAGFADPREDGFWLFLENFVTPDVLFRVEADGRVRATGIVPKSKVAVSGYRQTRLMARAADGVEVPVTLLHRADLKRDGSNPILINAYGSYGINSEPYFTPRFLALVEQGAVLALAHVRGGGEFGREWHEAGRFATKPNTWRDLIAVSEHLVREKWTRPGKLAITGTSAGGITAGRALTERPDLFAAVISRVGVSNALRTEFGQNGPPNVPEFGTVTDAQQFRALQAMDAYQNVKDGTRYPAVLLTTGMTDPRVDPWQAAKMAARLQKATASDAPVLLRVEYQGGHGLGSTRTQADQEWADIYSFVLWRAGHPAFQPRA